MADEAVKFGLTREIEGIGQRSEPPEKKVYGVSVAMVLNNIDCTGQARVQLMLPWLPGFTPWARLSSMMAGMGRGSFFVPMIGDEVLVAFNHGDVREPYVLGTLWNAMDRPPALSPTDAMTKRKIRTPLGHELDFDEATQAVTLSSNTFSTVTLDPTRAEISTPLAKVSIGKGGDVTITATTKLTLEAPVIEIKASSFMQVGSTGALVVKADGVCAVQGKTVAIN
ncbi:phage baseplate assembly protein V [Schlegelella sp. S2-27]|uniref:Phage baseplate assembly protein V n=1 Tax=Caldimonas mangrovi TaxID=2944811 RepID=A0ABT0YP95_9BURK|nr:phage baseplate assembly protein V [Caldimonas mangrovi]MCM5680488.1 phage baseplate assembly protein V [Caldimonas mangrovi]